MPREVTCIHPDLCALYDRNYKRGLAHWAPLFEGTPLAVLQELREEIDLHPGTDRRIEPGSRDIHDRAWYDAERDTLNRMIEDLTAQEVQ